MKILFATFILIAFTSFLCGEELLLQNDFDKAVEFAKKYYPIPTGTNTWIIIDDKDQTIRTSLPFQFVFTTIRINRQIACEAPYCFLGERNGMWFLLIDESTEKKIEIPEGLNIKFILPNAYIVFSVEKRIFDGLFRPSTKSFPIGINQIFSYRDGIIAGNTAVFSTKKPNDGKDYSKHQVVLVDTNYKEILREPAVINNRIVRYNPIGEGIIHRESVPLVINGNFIKAKEYKSTLYNLDMEKIMDFPDGWSLHLPFNNGAAVFVSKIDKVGDPFKYMFVHKTGKIIFETDKDIISGQNGIFRFRDLKTFLEGYIDQFGKIILPAKYEQTTNFINGKAFVTEREKIVSDGDETTLKCYEIDILGNKLREIKVGFDILPLLHRGFGISVNRRKPGLYKLDGTLIWTTDNKKIINRCFNFYQQFTSE
ncbi:MAG: WG repeat-containing protein [Bacteroidales bacterium]|jgi:hypothetical protein|nr:WG repeat-containing protein [Bacteroidales bacterium]